MPPAVEKRDLFGLIQRIGARLLTAAAGLIETETLGVTGADDGFGTVVEASGVTMVSACAVIGVLSAPDSFGSDFGSPFTIGPICG